MKIATVFTRLAPLVLLLSTAACVPHIFDRFDVDAGSGATLDTQQRVVLVTNRGGPARDKHLVVCAEPSPDTMSAIAGALAGKGGNGQIEAGLSGALSQSAAFIGIRTPTIQLLRDGLYRACEGYLNGVITQEDYSIILRNYDRVMVALLAIDAAGGFPHPAPVTISAGGISLPDGSAITPSSPGGGGGAGAVGAGGKGGDNASNPAKTPAAGQTETADKGSSAPSVKVEAPAANVTQVNNPSGITNADQVMKTALDYMLDDSKWLTAVCLTTLEQIAKIPPEKVFPPIQYQAIEAQIAACNRQLPANIQYAGRRTYTTDAAAASVRQGAAKQPVAKVRKVKAQKPPPHPAHS